MNSEFEVVSKSDGEGPFSAAVYNENIGEVVTAGPGFLTVRLICTLLVKLKQFLRKIAIYLQFGGMVIDSEFE